MALDEIWKVHSIERVPNGGSPLTVANLTIGALSQVAMPVNATANRTVQSGDIFATTGHIDFTSVDLTWTSFDAKQMLTLFGGPQGKCFAPGGDEYYVYIARWACNSPAAGAVHRRYKIVKGLMGLTTLQCDHKADVSLAARLRALYDGSNAPVEIQDSVALPTDAQIGDASARWTLHDGAHSQVNAVAVAGKRNINVDFGLSDSTQGADSDPFDTFGSIDEALPVVTISGVDPEWFDAIGLTINGKVVTHNVNAIGGNTRIVFRKRDGAGGFVLDATAEHIEMGAHGPAYFDNLLSGNAQDALTTSFRIATIEDPAGNAPLLFNVDVAA